MRVIHVIPSVACRTRALFPLCPREEPAMLTFSDQPSRLGRRDFLRVGALGLGGLSLPQLLSWRSAAAEQGHSFVKDKSVIFLFLHGGPSQIETFDPKMTAPADIRSATGEMPTSHARHHFRRHVHRSWRLSANKFSIVRSFRTGDANHDIKPIVGKETLGREHRLALRARRRQRIIPPAACRPTPRLSRERSIRRRGPRAGRLRQVRSDRASSAAAYAPFVPGGGGDAAEGHAAGTGPRPARRPPHAARPARPAFKPRGRTPTSSAGFDKFQQQAFDTILGGVAEAFDLSKEDAKTDRPLRHRAAGPARPDQPQVEQLQQLRRQRQDAGQAAAAGPAAVRSGLRLRHGDDELRLGHARRREQRHDAKRACATWARRSTTPSRRSSKTAQPAG